MKQQMYSNLDYFKLKLDVISGATENLKGLLAEEKREVRQELSKALLYCIDRGFKLSREGVHSKKWYKQEQKQKRKKLQTITT